MATVVVFTTRIFVREPALVEEGSMVAEDSTVAEFSTLLFFIAVVGVAVGEAGGEVDPAA